MSEQAKRARDMPQRWKWVTFPDRTSAMTTEPDGEWCKVEDVSAALEQAEAVGYRLGVEAAIEYLQKWHPARAVELGISGLKARLLSESPAGDRYREGVEKILSELDTWADVAFATEDEHPKYIVGFMTAVGCVKRKIPRLRARLLSDDRERLCILCKVPLVVGPPTCPRCGGHAWKEEGK